MSEEEKEFTHWRLCEHSRVRQIYRDPLISVGICYKCRSRQGKVTKLGGILSYFLPVNWYGQWVMGKVFKDNINWYKADEF